MPVTISNVSGEANSQEILQTDTDSRFARMIGEQFDTRPESDHARVFADRMSGY